MATREVAKLIVERLRRDAGPIAREFAIPNRVASACVDDLLPDALAHRIHAAFPPAEQMRRQQSFRERKYTAKQLDKFDPIIHEVTMAFQDPEVIDVVGEITGTRNMVADPTLYAGGISAMYREDYLLPHIDNSHDSARKNYRVLNLLYYVTPDWDESCGGNLELWDQGPRRKPRVLVSRFNRLILMATDTHSWHSVNRVRVDRSRACVSNYYFASTPRGDVPEYFHVTSFRGRPEQPVRDVMLRLDNAGRMLVRKFAKTGAYRPDLYKSDAGRAQASTDGK